MLQPLSRSNHLNDMSAFELPATAGAGRDAWTQVAAPLTTLTFHLMHLAASSSNVLICFPHTPQVRDRTLGLKAQILRNDETITKLLSMAVSGGR